MPVTKYITADGEEFDSYEDAAKHEAGLAKIAADQNDKFLRTSQGKELLKKHDMHEYGTWLVFGEDSNCDLSGSHHQPILGVYQGPLSMVVAKAVTLSRFWAWGSGGEIRKINIEVV
jgi:hypothetical protein